jgi:DUF2938 family protein
MTANDIGLIFLTGIGATMVTDIWSIVRKRLFAVPPPNFGLVGRWVAHMARGRFRHDSIAAATSVRGEVALGRIVHYAIGIAFAFLLPAFWGPEWIRNPTLDAALLVGVITVVAPFFIMQPAMGAGFLASRTPNPPAARFHSLITHAVYGLGLYIAARIVSYLFVGEWMQIPA